MIARYTIRDRDIREWRERDREGKREWREKGRAKLYRICFIISKQISIVFCYLYRKREGLNTRYTIKDK